MNLFSVAIMSDREILKFWREKETHKNEINIEWRRRHGINFPYTVTGDGVIMDTLQGAWLSDREVEQVVYDQANIIRNKRGLKT